MPKHYHKNPRKITDKQLSDLENWLDELGDLSGIVHDLNSDEIPAGNQRSKVFGIIKDEGVITLTEQLDEPTRQGTIARGYIEWHGERYGYRQVVWTPAQCERANLIANNAGGQWDWDVFAQFDKGLLDEVGFNADLLQTLNDEAANLASMLEGNNEIVDDKYSKKVESPIYEPSGEKPQISDLYDSTRTDWLIKEIDASDLPENEKEFLKIAAQRHTVLRFDRIANYYAHSNEMVQKLMEDSALIIIDFDKAIELGFVELSKQIQEIRESER